MPNSDTRTGVYDVTMACGGRRSETFAALVRCAAAGILREPEPYDVEIVLRDHSPAVTGVLRGLDGDALVIGIGEQTRRIGVESVERLQF